METSPTSRIQQEHSTRTANGSIMFISFTFFYLFGLQTCQKKEWPIVTPQKDRKVNSYFRHVKCFSGFPKFSKVSRFPEFLLLRRAGAHRHAGVWQGHPASAGGLNLPCQLFECHPGPGGVVKCHGLAITFPSSWYTCVYIYIFIDIIWTIKRVHNMFFCFPVVFGWERLWKPERWWSHCGCQPTSCRDLSADPRPMRTRSTCCCAWRCTVMWSHCPFTPPIFCRDIPRAAAPGLKLFMGWPSPIFVGKSHQWYPDDSPLP